MVALIQYESKTETEKHQPADRSGAEVRRGPAKEGEAEQSQHAGHHPKINAAAMGGEYRAHNKLHYQQV